MFLHKEGLVTSWECLEDKMATKNKPKHDGSGKGVRANKGRSGCKKTKSIGQGRRR